MAAISEKQVAAEAAADLVEDGMIVGLGTGSTAAFAVKRLGEKVRSGLSIRAIPTSKATHQLAEEEGITLIDFSEATLVDLTIDGADEIDENLNMIKGGGGALLREKIVAAASREVVTIVDSSKKVRTLGRFPLPVEVIAFGYEATQAHILGEIPARAILRMNGDQPFVTDNGNYILDCHLEKILKPAQTESMLNQIPGVVVNGLFVGLATQLIIANGEEIIHEIRPRI